MKPGPQKERSYQRMQLYPLVTLPYKVNEYVATEVLHIGSHSKEYIREVTERLNSVIEMGGTQADVAEVLHKIRQDLLEGKIRLNEPKK